MRMMWMTGMMEMSRMRRVRMLVMAMKMLVDNS